MIKSPLVDGEVVLIWQKKEKQKKEVLIKEGQVLSLKKVLSILFLQSALFLLLLPALCLTQEVEVRWLL